MDPKMTEKSMIPPSHPQPIINLELPRAHSRVRGIPGEENNIDADTTSVSCT